jgi:hypothetical protein
MSACSTEAGCLRRDLSSRKSVIKPRSLPLVFLMCNETRKNGTSFIPPLIFGKPTQRSDGHLIVIFLDQTMREH